MRPNPETPLDAESSYSALSTFLEVGFGRTVAGTIAQAYRRAFGRGRRYTETKEGFKSTEFMLALAAIVAILVATYVADADFGANDGWKYIAWVAAAYIVSRGLAALRDQAWLAASDSCDVWSVPFDAAVEE
jgi:hypothetical protein